MNDKAKENHLEDIVELDAQTLSVDLIERIARDRDVRKQYEEKYKNRLYPLLLLSLTHESFEAPEALNLWKKILTHMRGLNRLLGRDVGISVACLDFLANIDRRLSEPKIIEEHKSDFVTGTATVDEMTGLYVRDVFNVVLLKEIEEANRKHSPVCLLMIDLDDFKSVNDTWGHQAGDRVLERVGSTIGAVVREMDLAARYGGEEIAVIMPETRLQEACDVAERIRRAVEKIAFKDFYITVSVGVAQTHSRIETPETIIEAADKALYRAKQTGKNRIVKSDGLE